MVSSPSEEHARLLVQEVLCRSLTEWDNNDGTMKPDYRAEDSPTLSLEVKRVTVEEFRQLEAELRRVDYFQSDVLRKSWMIAMDLPTMETKIPTPPTARPPKITAADQAFREKAGFHVVAVEARMNVRSPRPLPIPRIKRIAEDLEELLVDLERRGIYTTRGFDADGMDDWGAVWAVERRIGKGIAMGSDPIRGQQPGIEILSSYGYARTLDPDVLVNRLEVYLTSDMAENLRSTLASVPPQDERHAFLVIDATEPEYASMREWGVSRLPSRLPLLPPEIDRLWIGGVGHLVWWCDREAGWNAHDLSPVHFP
jgi:hypothetical protein